MTAHSVMFFVFAALACGFAVALVVTTNVVRMAFYLVLSLSATAGLFFLAGADFVGAMQLMIYVGGTLVLLVFGVMLTAQQRFVRMRPSTAELAVGGVVGVALVSLLATAALSVPAWTGDEAATRSLSEPPRTAGPLAMALLGLRVDGEGAPDRAGYLLPFEAISVHLLVVLIGAAYLARPRMTSESLTLRPPGGFDPDQEDKDNPPTAGGAAP